MASIAELRKMGQRAHAAGDVTAAKRYAQRIKEAQAQEFNLGSDIEQNSGLRDLVGGAKHAFDRAAYGLANSVAAFLGDDVVDAIGPSRQERDAQLEKGRQFVDSASGWADVGELAGDIGIAAVPGGAVYRGTKLLANGLRSPVLRGTANIAGNALGNAGIAAGLTPENKEEAALMAGALGAGADVLLRGAKTVSAGLPDAMAGIKPRAKELMDEGVNIPFNKAAEAGWVNRMGEVGRAFPIAGPVLKAQDDATARSYMAYQAKKAMPPELPKVNDGGGVDWIENVTDFTEDPKWLNTLKDQWDDAYEALYRDPSLKIPMAKKGAYDLKKDAMDMLNEQLQINGPSAKEAKKIIAKALKNLDGFANGVKEAKESALINPSTGKPFVKQAGNSGSVPVGEINQMIRNLDTAAFNLAQKDRGAAMMVFKFAENLRDARMAGAPKAVRDRIKPFNQRYARFKVLAKAMQGLGSNNSGVASPGQLSAALKSMTKNKDTFALNRTFMGDELVKDAEVLGDKLPTIGPGTAEKLGAIEAYTNPSIRRSLTELAVGNMNNILTGQTGFQRLLNQPFVSQSEKARLLRQLSTGVPAGTSLYTQE